MTTPFPPRSSLRHLLLAAALLVSAPADAADWQKVLSDKGRTIEIDRASIFDSDRGTKVSWGRVVLGNEEAAQAGYRTVKALNRYDCRNSSFFTIKRVYLDAAERVLREESVADQTPVVVTRNSVDERMWREVCKPPGLADLEKIADAASQSAAAASAETRPVAAVPPLVQPPAKPPVAATAKAELRPQPPVATPPEKMPAKAAAPAVAAPPVKDTPAEALIKEKAAAEVAPEPTPAAMPIPSIRPNLAPLLAKDAVKDAPTKPEAVEPKPAMRISAPAPAKVEPPPPRDKVAETVKKEAAPPTRPPRPAAKPKAPSVKKEPKAAPEVKTQVKPSPSLTVEQVKGEGWSYGGDTGPERWGSLRPDWKICSEGKRQSPINLQNGVAVDLDPVKFDYRATRFRTTDTGNLLRVSVGEGMSIEVRGRRYELEHLTLHRPSEERVGGGASDMAVHFHHRSAEGRQAIVAVLLERGEQPNAMLQAVLNNLPLEKGNTYMPDVTIDLAAFLPTQPAHFLYMGSQTTPPCTEDVLWVVMKQTVLLSDDQLAIFNRLYPRNSRPIQPTNGRLVLESR
ncbi:MAG: carbonic anhydrase [Azoarcus sp. PHD]|nr:MAG: carbonic anhydrase [Azoarcus sp. PHD]